MKKILILSANPKDTNKLRLDEEARKIQEALKLAKNRDKFEIVTEWAVRVEDLRRALLNHEPHIVHFSGHGAGTKGLALEDNSGITQLVSSESLASLFELFRPTVECVLLNACYSEVQAQAIHQHVDYVIGMNQPIGDVAAIEFSTGFYDALGAGEGYNYAFSMGRASIQLKGSQEYLIPVLKSRPSSLSISTKTKSSKIFVAMEEQKPEQNFGGISQNVSGGNVYGGIKAVQGNNNKVTTTVNVSSSANEKQLTQQEVMELLAQIERLIHQFPELPEVTKEKSLRLLGTAKDEAEATEPDKKFAADNLKRMADTLKNVSYVTFQKSIWENIKLILIQLPTWLGVTETFFGF